MCCALFHGLFWQFKIWNLSKWPSVGPDGTYEYRLRPGQLARWIKWRTCDVGETKEGLENELWRRWSNGRVGEWAVRCVKRRKGWRMSCDVGGVCMLRRHIVLLSAIRPSDGDVKPGGPLGAFREEQAMSQHRVSPSPFLSSSSSSHSTQLH